MGQDSSLKGRADSNKESVKERAESVASEESLRAIKDKHDVSYANRQDQGWLRYYRRQIAFVILIVVGVVLCAIFASPLLAFLGISLAKGAGVTLATVIGAVPGVAFGVSAYVARTASKALSVDFEPFNKATKDNSCMVKVYEKACDYDQYDIDNDNGGRSCIDFLSSCGMWRTGQRKNITAGQPYSEEEDAVSSKSSSSISTTFG